jgi:Rieske Fe-S protein
MTRWPRPTFSLSAGPITVQVRSAIQAADGTISSNGLANDFRNSLVRTGDSGMGMTHGTIAGILVDDLIHGRDNSWAEVYDPKRLPIRATGEYATEGLNMALPYADWVTSGDVDSVDEIGRGEGAIVRKGLTKLAVYRDDRGALHAMSAVCPHLGGLVRWNSAEKTWDCPCHGSRFHSNGDVLHGPAHCGLSVRNREGSEEADSRLVGSPT